jgi:hypothetical protein
MNKQLRDQIATHLWKADGRPEYEGMGTVGRARYQEVSTEVLTAIESLGYVVSRRQRSAARRARPQPT